MAIIYPYFLKSVISVHDRLVQNVPYPFFDPACVRYEVLRAVLYQNQDPETVIREFGITEYEFWKSRSAFFKYGTAGLIGIDSKKITEDFPTEAERMIFVLKSARPWIPATKMTTLLKGFNHDFPVRLIRQRILRMGARNQSLQKYRLRCPESENNYTCPITGNVFNRKKRVFPRNRQIANTARSFSNAE